MTGSWLVVLVGIAALLFLLSTLPRGRRIVDRLGLPGARGRAPKDDRVYLLRVCGNDPERVARLLAEARRQNPEMTEAQAYRRAIRSHLRDRS